MATHPSAIFILLERPGSPSATWLSVHWEGGSLITGFPMHGISSGGDSPVVENRGGLRVRLRPEAHLWTKVAVTISNVSSCGDWWCQCKTLPKDPSDLEPA